MKKYCVDTSGFSNPVESLPDDIYGALWRRVIPVIEAGEIAVTTEIYDKMNGSLYSFVGACIDVNKAAMVLEIGDNSWDFTTYVSVATDLQLRHHDFISEYNHNRDGTVGLNDISIIALAKALNLPLVSMESSATGSPVRRRIPDVCLLEKIEHLTFNEFLRREGISL